MTADPTLDPSLSGRDWCDQCGQVTARRTTAGLWRHGWCEQGVSMTTYLDRIAGKTRFAPPKPRYTHPEPWKETA